MKLAYEFLVELLNKIHLYREVTNANLKWFGTNTAHAVKYGFMKIIWPYQTHQYLMSYNLILSKLYFAFVQENKILPGILIKKYPAISLNVCWFMVHYRPIRNMAAAN